MRAPFPSFLLTQSGASKIQQSKDSPMPPSEPNNTQASPMTPPEGITFLHHVGLFVSDFATTIARYEHLGFHFAPLSNVKFALEQGKEPVPIGASKRDAVLEKGFLEVVGVTDEEAWNNAPQALRERFDLTSKIARYEGIHVMFMGTSDMSALHTRLSATGLPSSEVGSMSRNVERPDGERTLTARFIHADQVLFAQFDNPEALFHPSFLEHPNGAVGLTGCIMCVEDPAEKADVFSKYTGHGIQKRSGEVYELDLGHSRILFVSPASVGEVIPGYKPPSLPTYAGIVVSTARLEKTRDFLSQRQVPFNEHKGCLVVGAEHASGCAVIFEEASGK